RRGGAGRVDDREALLRVIFADGDLARLFESRRDSALDEPIRGLMTRRPASVHKGSMMVDAVAIMAERKISELPVTDAGKPLGLIDITDILGRVPDEPSGIAEGQLPGVGAPVIHGAQPGPNRPKNPLFS